MNCSNCLRDFDPIYQTNPREAIKALWCPTWIDACEGPIHLCDYHAKTFQPDNPNALHGQFFWGQDAFDVFKKVESIKFGDNQYECCKSMINNGAIFNYKPPVTIGIVDGTVWLLRPEFILMLGSFDEAKETFPKLLS